MKRLLATVVMAGVLVLNVTPALAAEMPAPGSGPEFGTHLATMAPNHALDMGVDFGTMVNIMARSGNCAQ